MVKARVLMVEDDKNTAFLLETNLRMRDFEVDIFHDGESALRAFRKNDYDICVMDVMLPRMDGFQLAKAVKAEDKKMPIIFLTAKGMIAHKIEGFQLGADDYLTKPFNIDELSLRIEAVLNRTRPEAISPPPCNREQKHGNLTFNYTLRTVRVNGTETSLSAKEAELMNIFFEHKNQLVPREVILKNIWGEDNFFTAQSMHVYLTKIRKFIKDNPKLKLQNVHGVGYRLVVLE